MEQTERIAKLEGYKKTIEDIEFAIYCHRNVIWDNNPGIFEDIIYDPLGDAARKIEEASELLRIGLKTLKEINTTNQKTQPEMENYQRQQENYRRACNADIAYALLDLRCSRGLTIEQAAQLMDITPDRLASIENGNLPHNIHNLARLVEAMQARLAIIPTTDPTQPHCQQIETTE